MAFWEALASGGVSGVFKGAGEFAVKIREAVTGEAVLTAEQKAELAAQATAMEMFLLQADAEVAKQQANITLAEAQSASLFKSGWRPAVGWICVAGLIYSLLLCPLVPWLINLCVSSPVAPMPQLDTDALMTLLLGMLGLGGLRTWEKYKGLGK